MRRVRLLAAVAVLALAACGDDDADDAQAGHDDEATGEHDDDSPVPEGARRIEVTGRSFEFEPSEITVEVGEPIAIVLTSEDTTHDFTIDELDLHVAAPTGETEEGGFVADEAGELTFYCQVAGHRDAGMEGTLVVR